MLPNFVEEEQELEIPQGEFGILDSMFPDLDEPIEATCDLENPEVCESCQ